MASEPTIRPFKNDPRDPNFLRVFTYAKPSNKSVRLATIDWTHEIKIDGRKDIEFKKLMENKEMTRYEAAEWAKDYATKHQIPLIYVK